MKTLKNQLINVEVFEWNSENKDIKQNDFFLTKPLKIFE